MKQNYLFSFASLLFSGLGFAQISNLPHNQSFTDAFSGGTGNNISFYENYLGNEVQSATRIFRDATDYYSAPAALSIIPTGSFDGNVTMNLNLASYSSVKLNFKAKSVKNGTGTRPTKLTISTSIDGGTTWIGENVIGDFPNDTQANYSDVTYSLPANANNQSNVKVQIVASTGTGGDGTRAKLVIDDLQFAVSATPAVSVNSSAIAFSQTIGMPSTAQSVKVSGNNLASTVNLNVASPFEISTSENGTYQSSLSLTPSSGTLSDTDVFVRLNANASGSYTQNLTISSTGVSNLNVALTGNAIASSITTPAPHNLSLGSYSFDVWDASSIAGTYPSNMVFWTHSVTDPSASELFLENYKCVYNLDSRSRINGEGSNGISIINTGNSQYTGVCDGTDPTQSSGESITNGRNGAIVLALNATNRKDIKVNWVGRTILKNNRVYNLRLQYKIGTADLNSNWADVENGVYTSGEDNTFQNMNNTLPEIANDKSVVLLRWIYEYVSGSSSRAQIGLDDIMVSSDSIALATNENVKRDFGVYPNPVTNGKLYFNKKSNIKIYNVTGQFLNAYDNVDFIDVTALPKGVYNVVNDKNESRKVIIK